MRKNDTQILPGVIYIGWLDGSKLPAGLSYYGLCGMPVNIYADVHEIPFTSEPECSCKTERENGGRRDTATLTFASTELLPVGEVANMAFVVTDAGGESYLIGSKESPRAEVAVERASGTPSGDAAGYAYEVKHCSVKSLLPCRLPLSRFH